MRLAVPCSAADAVGAEIGIAGDVERHARRGPAARSGHCPICGIIEVGAAARRARSRGAQARHLHVAARFVDGERVARERQDQGDVDDRALDGDVAGAAARRSAWGMTAFCAVAATITCWRGPAAASWICRPRLGR
jgi:hypothetical protein